MLHQGEPMVADFGIALAVSMAGRERLTETGLSLGTPAYMSPEQASAEARLDGRSDQYSLASVLYEVLGGEPPYTGPTAQAIIAKRFSEPVPHLGTLRTVPPHVEGAVTRALAKSPADRFATLAAFAAALIRPTSEMESPRPRRLRRRHPAVTIAGVLSLAAIVVLVGLKLPRRQSAAVMPSQRQVTFSARANEPALSPDGRTLAYVSDGRVLVLEPLGGGESVILLRSHAWIAGPRWSPDGQVGEGGRGDAIGWAVELCRRARSLRARPLEPDRRRALLSPTGARRIGAIASPVRSKDRHGPARGTSGFQRYTRVAGLERSYVRSGRQGVHAGLCRRPGEPARLGFPPRGRS